ncbi:portal protein [Frateuria sp. GZRR33]|uniref:portal protein n=1 Tax=Frateuria sp. GZRR33 TaxID=3351535 RepID=UPI003EDC3451
MKEKRKAAKDGGNSTDFMKEMRERYERAVEADQENRELAIDDLKFVTVPGNQWDEQQRKARKGRPCYEFPILRSHWRQVVNDQKKARPGIKIRPVENGDAKGAELRQGLIRNIESRSNAERAYDGGFELLSACGFGAWRVSTEYSTDDSWDQDICVKPIPDPLTSVWFDPDAKSPDMRDARYAFVEESMSRSRFKELYPDAELVNFESAKDYGDWFGEESVRVAEYWRLEPVTKTLLLLSDGRTVDAAEVDDVELQQLQAQGITIERQRTVKTTKVVSSIVSGAEEIDGPYDSVFDRIPIVPVYANRHFIDGKWVWCGMVRFSRDPQKLVNYNFTTGQEVLAKQHKATPVLTPKMLEGPGVKALWDKSNVMDLPYLPFTPDPTMPGGLPKYLEPPAVHAAFAQFGQLAIDMLKASDGIFDASVGARSNETSGKAIMARQQEGDTATFDYQDALNFGIQSTGEILLSALPKVYDTPRAIRVLGKDGGEQFVQLYQPTPDGKVLNDLSAGKYDVTVTTGPGYDTQRMEFVDALVQLSQGNPLIGQAVPDLIVGSMDFPKADEAAERLKMLLPPPIQQAMQKGKDVPPEVAQMQAQMQQMAQMAQQQLGELQQRLQQAEAKASSKDADMLKAQISMRELDIKWYEAETARLAAIQKDQAAVAKLNLDAAATLDQSLHAHADRAMSVQQAEQQQAAQAQSADQQASAQ